MVVEWSPLGRAQNDNLFWHDKMILRHLRYGASLSMNISSIIKRIVSLINRRINIEKFGLQHSRSISRSFNLDVHIKISYAFIYVRVCVYVAVCTKITLKHNAATKKYIFHFVNKAHLGPIWNHF
jgi:hypothetical protein